MSRSFVDRWGAPVDAGNEEGVALFDEVVESLAALAGDPIAGPRPWWEQTTTSCWATSSGPISRLDSATGEGIATAAGILQGLAVVEGRVSEREVLHLRAARSWAEGTVERATRWLERALLHDPRDLLALKVAQDLYFFLGNRLDLRDVAARVLPAWPIESRGSGYVQGIYVFGLEENGEYGPAESRALAALRANPRDVWAVHARAHVFEMEGKPREGLTFLAVVRRRLVRQLLRHSQLVASVPLPPGAGRDRRSAGPDQGPIRRSRSTEWLDVVDAAAVLWRLSLFGVDVGEYAEQLAADIDPLVGEPVYLFNDWHAVMVFGLAGHHEDIERVLSGNRRRAVGTNRVVAERAGLSLL